MDESCKVQHGIASRFQDWEIMLLHLTSGEALK